MDDKDLEIQGLHDECSELQRRLTKAQDALRYVEKVLTENKLDCWRVGNGPRPRDLIFEALK